jgi:hypothetical protein
MASCQELADVDARSFAVADARLWNEADTVARSQSGLKAREQPHFREMRGPTADDAAPMSDGVSIRKHAKIAAMERRKARRLARGVSTHDVAPTGAPSPLFFAKEGKRNEARPARRDKRAAERWLFDNRIG